MKERKARVEDALHATRAAVEEGILPGGGVALLRASTSLKPEGLQHDEEVGYNIVVRACRSPLTMIAANAGQDGSVICEKVIEAKGNTGYNAATGEFEDLVKAGVIDPTKVTRTALQNAASVATLLLTSDALIAEKPKDEKSKRRPRPRRPRRHVLIRTQRAGCSMRLKTHLAPGVITGGFLLRQPIRHPVKRSSAYDFFPLRSTITVSLARCDAVNRRFRFAHAAIVDVRSALLDRATGVAFAFRQARFRPKRRSAAVHRQSVVSRGSSRLGTSAKICDELLVVEFADFGAEENLRGPLGC